MNKESIYQIIGYQGEYTESVKKALKKLLKENHPDHGGDSHIFKLINEVKKELETGKITYKYKAMPKEKKYDDIDYDYCKMMINKLEKEITKVKKDIKNDKIDIDSLNKEYQTWYRKSIEKETTLLNNHYDLKKLNNLKKRLIIMLIILIIIFSIAVIKKEILLFSLFAIIALCTIIDIRSFYVTLNDFNKKNENKLTKYVNVVGKIRNITKDKQSLEERIIVNERKLLSLENDLRFYNNLIDNK